MVRSTNARIGGGLRSRLTHLGCAGAAALALAAASPAAQARGIDCTLGETIWFAGDFVPANTMKANGQTLQVAQHSALFQILGNRFGGNGKTTFALPDLTGTPVAKKGVLPLICTQGVFQNR